ncbi:hypothetical protein A3Q56_04270 [Intoshia linei]|uniref:Uncharacterized protein n=1 Tax=Intoshia linei TaxID=1819745 RepID=A0A177B311_9BILA|nr:hypothetical protein A3Q56_04270 [Intoshia linei]
MEDHRLKVTLILTLILYFLTHSSKKKREIYSLFYFILYSCIFYENLAKYFIGPFFSYILIYIICKYKKKKLKNNLYYLILTWSFLWSIMMHYTMTIVICDISFLTILATCSRMISTVSYISPKLETFKSKSNQPSKPDQLTKNSEMISKEPQLISNFTELFFYQTSSLGFPLGPLYNYEEFLQINKPSRVYFTWSKFIQIILYAIVMNCITEYIGKIDDTLQTSFYDKSSYLQAIIYITLLAATFRLKITVDCMFVEMLMNVSGVPVYNKNNKTKRWLRGMDFFEFESKNSIRTVMMAYNKSTQLWIYRCFYKINNLKRFNKPTSLSIVIAFNVLWHGPYLMYGIAGILFTFVTIMQDRVIQTFTIYENKINKTNGMTSLKDLNECYQYMKTGKLNVNIFFNLTMWIFTHLTIDFLIMIIFTSQFIVIWNLWTFLFFYPIINSNYYNTMCNGIIIKLLSRHFFTLETKVRTTMTIFSTFF